MTESSPCNPPNSQYQAPEPVGTGDLGGSLILVATGLVVSPIRLGIMVLQIFVLLFSAGTWEILTTPGTE